MLHFLVLSFVLISKVTGNEFPDYCSVYGDPYITPFASSNVSNSSMILLNCALPKAWRVLFHKDDVSVKVLNDGLFWDTIIDFSITYFDHEDQGQDYTITPTHFQSVTNPGIDRPKHLSQPGPTTMMVNLSTIIVEVQDRSTHYKLQIWTSSRIAKASRGMCFNGCPAKKIIARSSISRAHSQDQKTSSLAQEICNSYLQQFRAAPTRMLPFIEATRQACINDVTITGNRKFAEDAEANVISVIATLNAASINDIESNVKKARKNIGISNMPRRTVPESG